MELLVPLVVFEIYDIISLRHFYSLCNINCNAVFFMIVDVFFITEALQTVHTEMFSFFVFCLVVHKLMEVFDEYIVLLYSTVDLTYH